MTAYKAALNAFKHHVFSMLFSTLALALLLLAAEHMHWFNWADVVTLQIAGSHEKLENSDEKAADLVRAAPITAVKIGDEVFEKLFQEQSPLDKNWLGEIVQAIAQAQPKVLVIDIDLSPSVKENVTDGTALRPIDQALSILTKAGTAVILPIPEFDDPDPGKLLPMSAMNRYDWVKMMCKSGVLFASSNLFSHLGTVTKLRKSTNPEHFISLAELAYLQYQGSSKANLCDTVLLKPNIRSYLDFQSLEGPKQGEVFHSINMRSLSTSFRQAIGSNIIWNDSKDKPSFVFSKAIPREGIVILGGAYKSIDQHLTPKGNVYGVELHAAMITSHARPVEMIPEVVSVIVELFIGTMVGFLFMALWCCYEVLMKKYRQHYSQFSTQANSKFSWGCLSSIAALAGYRLIPLLWLLVVCVIPFALTYVALFALQSLIDSERWMNPAPFIFGLFLHSILVRVEGLQEALAKTSGNASEQTSHGFLYKCKHLFIEELGVVIVIVLTTIFLVQQYLTGAH
jgi:CHASE2 domain-containing sensor protein